MLSSVLATAVCVLVGSFFPSQKVVHLSYAEFTATTTAPRLGGREVGALVDATGSLLGNPACVDGPTDKVQTYISHDVPALIQDRFRVEPDQQKWTIGGLSYGGRSELDIETRGKIAALSEEWVSEKALPEMGFTLGGLDELTLEGTKLFCALDSEGHLHGVTSWLPVREQGAIVGYTLDFMRRDAQGFRSVIELLVADALREVGEQGARWISLSGAPLAPAEGAAKGALEAVLDRAGEAMEPLYGFRSLAAFKKKFQPEHRGWNLAYDDELALGAIALAVVSSYLPELSAREAAATAKYWLESQRQRREVRREKKTSISES